MRCDMSFSQLIDPLLTADPLVVPDAENALALLQAAARKVTASPIDAADSPEDFSQWPADPYWQARYSKWIDENQEAIKQADEALRFDRAAFSDSLPTDDVYGLAESRSSLFRLLHQHLLRQGSQGNLQGAAATGRSMLKAARLLKGSGGVLVDYMLTCYCETIAHVAVCGLVRSPKLSAEMLRPLLDELSDAHDHWKSDLRRMFQAEFFRETVPLLKRAKDHGLAEVINVFADPWTAEMSIVGTRECYEGRRQQLDALFDGHPRPFDYPDTVHRAGLGYAAAIRELDLPWNGPVSAPDPGVPKELAVWPDKLRFSGLDFGRDLVPDVELAAARRALRNVKNPIGKMFVYYSVSSFGQRNNAHQDRARRRGARLAVAAAIYLREKGTLPAELEHLVTAGIIDRIPTDPVVDKPMLFSPVEQRIWLPSAESYELSGWEFEGTAFWSLAPRPAIDGSSIAS